MVVTKKISTTSPKSHSLEQIQPSNRKNEILSPKAKVILCALAIIVGLGCLATGMCGYFQVGSLSSLNQIHTIILTATGSVVAIVGIIVSLCRARSEDNKKDCESHVSDSNNIDNLSQKNIAPKVQDKVNNREADEKTKKEQEEQRDAAAKAHQETAEKARKESEDLAAEAKAKAEKEAKEKAVLASMLPDLVDLQLQSSDPVLQPLNSNIFRIVSFGVEQIDQEFLHIPLQFWINRDKDSRWNDPWFLDWRNLMADPKRKPWIETIDNRIEVFDKAIQLKERLGKLAYNQKLVVGNLLPPFPNGALRFMLMTDDELARLKVSDIKKEQDRKAIWDVLCNRLPPIASRVNSPNLSRLTQADIGNLLLTDLMKLKANHINSFLHLFPRITFLLIELQEFKNINVSQIANLQEIVEIIFEGPYGDREKSKAAKRLLSCEPQTVYQLSPYLPKQVWGLLDPPLLSKLDFSQIFAGIKEEKDKKSIIEAIFEGPYGDGKNSRAAKRLQNMQPPQVEIIKPYLPALATRLL